MNKADGRRCIPVAVCWDHIVDAQLLADLLDAKMKRVRLKLLAGHVGHDGGGQAHEASSLVLRRLTPTAALLSLARAIGDAARFRVAATLEIAVDDAILFGLAAKASLAQGDVVRTRDALASPSHIAGPFRSGGDVKGGGGRFQNAEAL